MSAQEFGIKRRVWVGLGIGIAVVGLWSWWNQAQDLVDPRFGQQPKPFVQLAGTGKAPQNQLLRERAELFDPTPLFFPTEWNFGQQEVRESLRRQPGQVFGSFPAKPVISDQNIGIFGMETTSAPEKLSDVLAQGNEAPFAGMGQIDLNPATLPVRSGFMEIYAIDIAEEPIKKPLTGLQSPRGDYAPMEFIVLVGVSGLVGEPILLSGSGWDDVDAYFRDYLLKTYRLGERLAPGRYRVVVGA